MSKRVLLQTSPFVVPTNDGKLIEEHFGLASIGDNAFSVARMVAPPGWSEPFQTPNFDEVTIVIKGKKQIETEEGVVELSQGQTLLVKSGTRVRYANPYDEEVEYWSLCVPAFSIQSVNREA